MLKCGDCNKAVLINHPKPQLTALIRKDSLMNSDHLTLSDFRSGGERTMRPLLQPTLASSAAAACFKGL